MKYTLEHDGENWVIFLGLKPVAVFLDYYQANKRLVELNSF